ncbi:hypothetical protein Ciccas_002781, partial [Cichlidogyrus casuarinus]
GASNAGAANAGVSGTVPDTANHTLYLISSASQNETSEFCHLSEQYCTNLLLPATSQTNSDEPQQMASILASAAEDVEDCNLSSLSSPYCHSVSRKQSNHCYLLLPKAHYEFPLFAPSTTLTSNFNPMYYLLTCEL